MPFQVIQPHYLLHIPVARPHYSRHINNEACFENVLNELVILSSGDQE